MSDKVLEIAAFTGRDDPAAFVSNLWDTYNNQRAAWLQEKVELQQYIFATDTTTTTNRTFRGRTPLRSPSLLSFGITFIQITSLHYFPMIVGYSGKGYTKKDSSRRKAKVITAYMENKTRESRFRQEVSRLLYDYIDFGNAFVIPSYERRYKKDRNGTLSPGYTGPRGHRISPHDIVLIH